MFKRLTLLALGLALLLVSCASPEKESEPEEEEAPLDGYICTIIQDRGTDVNIFGYQIDTVIGDNMLTHVDNVGKRLGCDIVIDGSHGFAETGPYVSTAISSGTPIAEIVYITGNNYLATLAYADMLYPISDFIDTLDYINSTKYGYPSNLEAAMKDSVPYAVQPTLCPETAVVVASVILFNNDILRTAGISDPREFLDNRSWNWDNFLDLLSKATLDNGDSRVYGLCANPNQITPLAILSNGIQLVVDTGESLTTDIYSDKAVRAIEFIQELYKNYAHCLTTKYGGSAWNIANFINGDAAMEMTYGNYAVSGGLQYDSKIDFGLLPFPCGPDGEYGKWAHQTEAIYGFGIPVVADLPDYAAIVIDALFDPIEAYEGITMEDYYAQNVFVNPRDAQTYCEIAKNGRYSYWPVNGTLLYNAISTSYANKTATELLESYGPGLEKVIEEYMMPNYDYLSEFVFK